MEHGGKLTAHDRGKHINKLGDLLTQRTEELNAETGIDKKQQQK